jgi:Putative Ig domain
LHLRHHGDGPARRRRLATVTSIALLAGAGLLAGAALAGTPSGILDLSPAAASTPVSSHFVYACGASFTPGKARCLAIRNTAAHPIALTVRPGAIPSGNGYSPSDLQSAYNLTAASNADGTGRTVAVVDAYDDPTAASDLAAYRSAAGLPALTSGQFTVYNQDGQTTSLPSTPPATATTDWNLEESLDVDMVSAICPHCNIDLVEAETDNAQDLLTAELTAATTPGVKYISDSWGGLESSFGASNETTLDSEVFSAPGVVYVAAAGDAGYAGGVIYPAVSPNVVSVGGTTLEPASNSRGWTESVWDTLNNPAAPGATESGCSAFEAQPSWQTSVSIIPPACPNRVDNDVAAAADPTKGAAVFDTSDGGWVEAGGTSEAAPIIASVFALAGNGGNGGNKAADSIYTHTADLNEVTASNNGTCTPSLLCTATGAANTYNGPTGWGTPNGITAFQSNSVVSNTVSVTGPGSQTGTVGTAVSLKISATDSDSSQTLTYSAVGLPAGLQISSSGLISGTPTAAGASQVTVTATDSTGASGSTSFTWTISPAAGNTVTVTNPGSQTGTVGTAASLQISATDSASGQTLTYSASGLPAGLSINASTGLISGTPTTAGTSQATVTATDTTSASGSQTFTWTISPAGGSGGNTITVSNPGSLADPVGTAVSVQISATDSDSSQTLTYSATGLPAGLSISSAGLITGTVTTAGTSQVTVTATDATSASGTASFTWTVSPAGGPSTVRVYSPGSQNGFVGIPASLQILAIDSDPNQSLTYAANGLPAGLSINSASGLIAGTPTTAGTSEVRVTVTDTSGASGTVYSFWTISPATPSCSARQLLGNPGFETGSIKPWSSTRNVLVKSRRGLRPQAGNWLAWLDGYGAAHADTLAQTVTLPSVCKNAVLSFWVEVRSNVSGKTQQAKNTLVLDVLNASGKVVKTVLVATAAQNGTRYVEHTVNLAAYAGQKITIKFIGTEVRGGDTSFLEDSNALNVS